MRARLLAVEEIPDGAQITIECTFKREGGDKPVRVAESLARVYLDQRRQSKGRRSHGAGRTKRTPGLAAR